MAFSGSYDYGATATQICTAALEDVGAIGEGATPSAAQITTALRTLNWMVKQWSGEPDFAPGLKSWTRKRAYLFFQANQSSYSLGPSGDHATLTYVRTTLAAAASAGASTIDVSSATGIATTYAIAVELDSGSLDWTTVNGAPSGTTVTLTATLDSAAAAGNSVYCYATKLQARPIMIETAMLRYSDGTDRELYSMDVSEYEGLVDKAGDGEPSGWYYEPTLVNGTLYLDTEPDDMDTVLRIVYQAPPDDLDAEANDLYYPQHWFAALEYGLAKRLSVKYPGVWNPVSESVYMEALTTARNLNPQTVRMFFEPERD